MSDCAAVGLLLILLVLWIAYRTLRRRRETPKRRRCESREW